MFQNLLSRRGQSGKVCIQIKRNQSFNTPPFHFLFLSKMHWMQNVIRLQHLLSVWVCLVFRVFFILSPPSFYHGTSTHRPQLKVVCSWVLNTGPHWQVLYFTSVSGNDAAGSGRQPFVVKYLMAFDELSRHCCTVQQMEILGFHDVLLSLCCLMFLLSGLRTVVQCCAMSSSSTISSVFGRLSV